jgi:hypothetical protein
MAYAPVEVLVAVWGVPSRPVAVTVAEEITAPVGSATVPWRLPVWAKTGKAERRRKQRKVEQRCILWLETRVQIICAPSKQLPLSGDAFGTLRAVTLGKAV